MKRAAWAIFLAGCAVNVPEPTVEMAGGDEARLEDLRAGRRLYVAKCGGCHRLYSVEDHPDAAWAAQVREMIELDKVKLSVGERDRLVRYLTTANGRD